MGQLLHAGDLLLIVVGKLLGPVLYAAGLANQGKHLHQQVVTFRVHHQHRDAQLLQRAHVVLELQGHDDQVGIQGGTGLHVELLQAAHRGLLQQPRCGHLVDGTALRLVFQAHHPVVHSQGDGGVGGDVVAAHQGLGGTLQGNFPSGLVGKHNGRALLALGAVLSGAGIGSVSAAASGGRHRQQGGQSQGGQTLGKRSFQVCLLLIQTLGYPGILYPAGLSLSKNFPRTDTKTRRTKGFSGS